ncbi:MAG: hypothetical protein NTX58_06200 [Actinobacteria bacterium]|nr:hypothetical protein [Actinomycetota bacterium]
MPLIISGSLVEPITKAALGAIDVDGGSTQQQRALLGAIVEHLWKRPDLDLGTLEPLSPSLAAAAITEPEQRRRFLWMVAALELCRRPISPAQIDRINEYAVAFETEDVTLEIARTWLNEGADRAQLDILRFFRGWHSEHEETQLLARKVHADSPDEQMLELFESFENLPEGTLGREFLEFHTRNEFELPGLDPERNILRTVFCSHDMNHVITGYEPTPSGEIALAAMSFAAGRCEPTWAGLLLSMAYHEGRLTRHDEPVPLETTLSDPAAVELLGEALDRGSECSSNFTFADHLSMADWQLSDVRARYNITPRRLGLSQL